MRFATSDEPAAGPAAREPPLALFAPPPANATARLTVGLLGATLLQQEQLL